MIIILGVAAFALGVTVLILLLNKKLFNHYSINLHRGILILYAILFFLISVSLFAFLLRGLFQILLTFDLKIFDIGALEGKDEHDVGYMADFLGGVIGIILGFLGESFFISRLNHIKDFEALNGILVPELKEIKSSFDSILIRDKLPLCSSYEELITLIDKINNLCSLEHLDNYDNKYLLEYENLFVNLTNIEFYKGSVTNINIISKYLAETTLNHSKTFRKPGSKALLNESDTRFEALKTLIKKIVNIDYKTIDIVILKDIMEDSNSLSTIHNLPRIMPHNEKKGHIVEILKTIYIKSNNFNNSSAKGIPFSQTIKELKEINNINTSLDEVLTIIDYKKPAKKNKGNKDE